MGDRFAHHGKAQLQAVLEARKAGIDIVPAWNKSFREHSIVKRNLMKTFASSLTPSKNSDCRKPLEPDMHFGVHRPLSQDPSSSEVGVISFQPRQKKAKVPNRLWV